jgi:hypothetical protein
MSERVSFLDVKQIISTDLDVLEIKAYIAAANAFVDGNLLGKGLSDVQLKEIERWMTAHLIASTREQQAKSESAGGASITYQGVTGTGLNSTFYGQQAVVLDSSGTLLCISSGIKMASMYVVPSFDS